MSDVTPVPLTLSMPGTAQTVAMAPQAPTTIPKESVTIPSQAMTPVNTDAMQTDIRSVQLAPQLLTTQLSVQHVTSQNEPMPVPGTLLLQTQAVSEQSTQVAPIPELSNGVPVRQVRMRLPETESRSFRLVWDGVIADDSVSRFSAARNATAVSADGATRTASGSSDISRIPSDFGAISQQVQSETGNTDPRFQDALLRFADLEQRVAAVLGSHVTTDSPVALHVQSGMPAGTPVAYGILEYTDPAMAPVIESIQPQLNRTIREWAQSYPTRGRQASNAVVTSAGTGSVEPMLNPRTPINPQVMPAIPLGSPDGVDFSEMLEGNSVPLETPEPSDALLTESALGSPTQEADGFIMDSLEAQPVPMQTPLNELQGTAETDQPTNRVSIAEIHQQLRAEMTSQQSNRTNAVRDLEFHLTPDHLGRLVVRITEQGNTLSAHFQVESTEARQMLETEMSSLRRELEESGIEFSRLDVSLQDREQRPQRRWFGERPSRQRPRNQAVEATTPVRRSQSRAETRVLNVIA